MAVLRNVCDNSVATTMRVDNAETVQERASVLMCFKPLRQRYIVQTLFMFPGFDGNTIDFPVPFIVLSGNMLGSEVENPSDTCLFQVFHQAYQQLISYWSVVAEQNSYS